ncbi:MAG: SDR family oxidoreductase [Pseudomonadales bacterium]|nr:SDR family oxidoreductase [Pseudomonadales bacterium]
MALITGATSGIGLATARYLASTGASLMLAARSLEAGENLVAELSQQVDVRFTSMDVTVESEVEALLGSVKSEFGKLDFAFNNAGVFRSESILHEHSSEVWDEVIDSNLKSVYFCMKHELRLMLETENNEHRAIINNASVVGHRGGNASGVSYTAAKHGVLGLTRQAAVNYARTSIRVNAVSPGPTLTAATAPRLELPPAERSEKLGALNPTGQLVLAEDIAKTVAFLCSPEAQMINGQDIVLDGGQLAKL